MTSTAIFTLVNMVPQVIYIILAMDLPTIYYKNCMMGKSIVQPEEVPPRSYIEATDQLMYSTINVKSYSKCANTYLAIMKET